MASRRCWTDHLWKRKSRWLVTILSTCPISMPRSRGQRVARAQVTESWKCAQSGPWDKRMNFSEGDAQARSTADAVARRSYGKLVAFLVARTRDVAAAEDALSEAFTSALTDWPLKGCPSNPEAWLLTVARRKIIDMFRGRHREELAAEQLQVMAG